MPGAVVDHYQPVFVLVHYQAVRIDVKMFGFYLVVDYKIADHYHLGNIT